MAEGIRQGRARSISDETRRRAKEAIAERNDGKSYDTPAESFKVSMGKPVKASPITKQEAKKEVKKPEAPKPTPPKQAVKKPEAPKLSAKDKAAAAREKMFSKSGPIGDAIDVVKRNTPSASTIRDALSSGRKRKLRATGPDPERVMNMFRSSPDTDKVKNNNEFSEDYACGGKVKKAAGGSISKRADGVAQRGKTRCKYI